MFDFCEVFMLKNVNKRSNCKQIPRKLAAINYKFDLFFR